ncbi:MAG: pyridoxamine 5'-phosphate oxidase family protein [Phycisphaeraceae bacterium]
MSDLAIDQQIETFLALCKTASLATIDAHGKPCNANIQYASDKAWRLHWVSGVKSAHSVNLEHKPEAAVTIYAHQDTPERIHGLQLRGTAGLVDSSELRDVYDLYAAKYPFVTGPPYDKAMKLQQFYCFTPSWLRWIDNREGFGWKIEKTIER